MRDRGGDASISYRGDLRVFEKRVGRSVARPAVLFDDSDGRFEELVKNSSK